MKKKSSSRRPRRRAGKRALPPKDNPWLRHQKLNLDRKFGTTEKKLGLLRLKALEHVRNMPRPDVHRPMPPSPGISNWVQMGPTAIPGGQTYSPARVLVTGRVTAIIIDPTNAGTIYLGSAQGGVWKTIDGGKHWVAKSDNEVSLAIGALAIDPTNHLVVYAGTGEGNFSLDSYYGGGVLRSTNGGDSWTLQGAAVFGTTRFSRIVINPGTPATIFAATGNGIYRTTNSGAAWTKLSSGLPSNAQATDVAVDPSAPNTVYAAFWAQGIYRTTNANAATPAWTKLAGGLPTGSFTRIALGVSASSPQTVYALMSGVSDPNPDNSYLVNNFLRSTNGGTTWNTIALPGGNIGGQGFYNLNVAVDPTTPDIVYLSGISLWKAVRNTMSGVWTINDIGGSIHPDNHAFAFAPTNHQIIYAGSDGGIYTSVDGGTTWSDTINEGPCITQFEFMDQHPSSDAFVIGGTQDNGTEEFRNSPVFYHADDGDGGFVMVDQNQPRNVLSTYYDLSPKRSTAAGRFGSWVAASNGLFGSSLFYPPLTLDQSNQNNAAIGGDAIFLDAAQGTGGWPTRVTLPGLSGEVSAIDYVNSSLIYAGSTTGQVYRLTRSGATWTATAIHSAPLPSRFIWDVATLPGDVNTIIVVMSGFGAGHVWRGAVPLSGATTWTNISGSGGGVLPDIPVNALVIEPAATNTMYIGTDIGVFRTTDAGTTWAAFSDGLPNVAVFDMKLHDPSRLLRVATHGRGMWERKLDTPSMSDVNLYLRDNVMDSGRVSPSPSGVTAAFDNPGQHVTLGDLVWSWQCADIKVDALEGSPLAYQIGDTADVDYLAFEDRLEHRNPQRGRVNRIYVQVHNRGILPATNVTVKVLYADASAGVPDLPPDFWTTFPNNSANTSGWTPIGTAKVIPVVSPVEPAVVEWDWNTPTNAADHTCLLAVVDCAADPIPAGNKIFNGSLHNIEKRVGLKNLHVINALPGTFYWTPFQFFAKPGARSAVRIYPSMIKGWNLGIVLPKTAQKAGSPTGFTLTTPTKAALAALKERMGSEIQNYDLTKLYMVRSLAEGGMLEDMAIPRGGLRTMMFFAVSSKATSGGIVTIVQESGKDVLGGSTFVLRTAKARAR